MIHLKFTEKNIIICVVFLEEIFQIKTEILLKSFIIIKLIYTKHIVLSDHITKCERCKNRLKLN